MIIGIRREDKNKWERRVPLVPNDLEELKFKHSIDSIVQPSDIRCFTNKNYLDCGVGVSEDISSADVVFAIKEIPLSLFRNGKTYVFFSHSFKGQSHNMPMLRRLMELGCNLIDYEKIVDEAGKRLIFFGSFAGFAGMIDSLHLLGDKFKAQGYSTPLEKIKFAHEYNSLEEAKIEIKRIGQEISEKGLPAKLAPIVIGFAGYGNVSKGAQEIFNLLPHKIITPDILPTIHNSLTLDNKSFYKVVFKESDMFRRKEGAFNLSEYFSNPENYKSKFETYLPYLTALINCIFWTDKYPRIVTKKDLSDALLSDNLKLKFIGDISCDINGSVEITYKATTPDNPVFTYFPNKGSFSDNMEKDGVTVLAIDNLPCELPKESSSFFSSLLKQFAVSICNADFNLPFEKIEIDNCLKKAIILHKGKLTDDFKYLEKFVKDVK